MASPAAAVVTTKALTGLDIGIIALYFVIIFGIGVYFARKGRSSVDYFLAGRNLGYPLAIFSIFATWFGAETCVGSAGAVYAEGLSGGSADPFGYALCLLLMGVVFAAPLWRRKLTTLADLFRERYSPGVERLAVLMMAPTSIMWAAAQIRAFGQVVAASSEIGVDVRAVIKDVAEIKVDVRAVKGDVMAVIKDVAEIKGKISQMPTTFQMQAWFVGVSLGLVALVFAVARALK